MKESKSHQKRMFWLKIQEGVYPVDSITLRGLAATTLVPTPTLHMQSLQCTQPESEFKTWCLCSANFHHLSWHLFGMESQFIVSLMRKVQPVACGEWITPEGTAKVG